MSHPRRSRGLRFLKSTARASLASVMYGSGAMKRLLSFRLQDRAVVLMYHRVLPSRELANCSSHPGIVVSQQAFELQMEWLNRNCHCLTLDDFIAALTGEQPFPRRSCLVTFDDGWRDNHLYALETLAKFRVPAVIFLTTGLIGSKESFWQERMVGLIRRLRSAPESSSRVANQLRGDPLLGRFSGVLSADEESAGELLHIVVGALKRCERSEVETVLERLSALVGGAATDVEEDRPFMNWAEVQEMERHGIVFGSHGMTHRILTDPGTNREAEIIDSKAAMERRLGRPVRAFCYPNGNCDESVVRLVREGGYEVAFSTKPGYVSAGSDPYRLERLDVHETMTRSIPMFVARLARVW